VKRSPRFKKLRKSERRPPPGNMKPANDFPNTNTDNIPHVVTPDVQSHVHQAPQSPTSALDTLPVSVSHVAQVVPSSNEINSPTSPSSSSGWNFIIWVFLGMAMVCLIVPIMKHGKSSLKPQWDRICSIYGTTKLQVTESSSYRWISSYCSSLKDTVVASPAFNMLREKWVTLRDAMVQSETWQYLSSLTQRVVNSPAGVWLVSKMKEAGERIKESKILSRIYESALRVHQWVFESKPCIFIMSLSRQFLPWCHVKEISSASAVSSLDENLRNDLSAFLAAAKLSHHEQSLRDHGFAEPLDLVGADDADLVGLKVAEKKRLLRALSQLTGISVAKTPNIGIFQRLIAFVRYLSTQALAYIDKFLALFGTGPQVRSSAPRPPRAPPPPTLSSTLYGGRSQAGGANRNIEELHRRHSGPNDKGYRNSYELLGGKGALNRLPEESVLMDFQSSFDLLDEEVPLPNKKPINHPTNPTNPNNNKKVTFNKHDQVRSIPPRPQKPMPQPQFRGSPFDEI
jgi:hypothetical protein